MKEIIVIGGGLAGSEAAWQAAQAGAQVTLYEMRPFRMTPAHTTDLFAELVCSNSLGSDLPDRALGLLKRELRRLGSLVIACADRTAVPAGDALAVGRDAFAHAVTQALTHHPRITIRREELTAIPAQGPVIIATGPLTSPKLAAAIQQLAGQEQLSFYDAMAPIVTAESINLDIVFRANRYGRPTATNVDRPTAAPNGDYLNAPLTREQYYAFVEAVRTAEKIPLRDFESDEAAQHYFEACLPIEVLAARHPDALAFGPMSPAGLRDPRTGRRPFAVVQLRQDDMAGRLYNLVGFQTNLRWAEQERILRMIPGLERAEFVRLGQMHRNTFLNSPALLLPTLQWRGRADLFFAGQITGTEGYVGAIAGGWLAGVNAARYAAGRPPITLPPTTMMGALFNYITRSAVPAEGNPAPAGAFQPMKANFGLLPELDPPIRDKRLRHAAYVERALNDLEAASRTW